MANLARSVVERSVYSSGTVEYEEPIPPDSEDGEGSENYEEPRSQWTGSQDIESSGYIIPEHRPEPLTAVSSTASCQSHFHSKSSGLQLLGVKNKGSPAHKGKGTKKGRCRVLFLVVVLGIILVGLIALVLGAVAVKGKLCRGDVSCSSSDSEEESVMRSEFARLQEQIQSLKSSVLSARFNSSDLYMGCIPMTHVCTVLPLPEGYLVEPRGPVCTTQRLRIEGFYPVGNQCSISSTGTVERVDFNGRPIESRRDITAKPVMSNDRIFCECYTSVSSRTAIEPPVVQCQHSVTLCPRSLPIM